MFFFFGGEGHAGSSMLHRLFSSCDKQGLLFTVVHGLLTAVAPLVAEHGLWGTQASGVVVHMLSCSTAYEIFPDQGANQ